MKIQSITLENFRSVQSTVTIPLRPITLLFGPNSAGKSSILQSLLTFREVLKNRNANPHFVYGGGKHIDLGGFEALVNGHDLDKDLKIKIEFTIDDDGITDGSTLSRFIEQSGFWRLQDFGKVENGYVQIILSYDQKIKAPYVSEYEVGLNGERFGSIKKEYFEDRDCLSLDFDHPLLKKLDTDYPDGNLFTEIYKPLCSRLLELSQNRQNGIENVSPDGEGEASVIPKWGEELNLDYGLNSGDYVSLVQRRMPIHGLDETSEQITGLDFDGFIVGHEYFLFLQPVTEAFVILGGMALNYVNEAIYLGPIRAIPERHYSSPEHSHPDRWADGLAAWDSLCLFHKERGGKRKHLINKISDQLSSPEMLDLGYSLEILESRELPDLKIIEGDLAILAIDDEISTGPIVSRIEQSLKKLPISLKVQLKDEKRGISVHPDDIGVGVSQVIPVVVGAMDPSHKMFFIEQPELHIHPRVQCALGDLFIEQINASEEKLFLLETHSEHLILRLLRRIRETAENDGTLKETRKLAPEKLAIIYIDSDENGMAVTEIGVDEDGEFTGRWPDGFFGERSSELM